MGERPNLGRGFVRQSGVRALAELEPIYRAEFDNLVRALTLLAGSREVAADAVQEAFVSATLRWKDIDLANPVAWVRTVAARKLLDGHRRSGRWTKLLPSVGRAQATVAPAAEDLSGDSDLLRAVAELPERQRAAVVLHYLNDWSVDDVAAALRIAPGTVKSSLSDARRTLRSHLEGGLVDG